MHKQQYVIPSYLFVCPVCHQNDAALVKTGVKVSTPIVEIFPGYVIEWGVPEHYDYNYKSSWFQCMQCGYKVEKNGRVIPGEDLDSFLEWLQENNGSVGKKEE